MRYVLAVAAVLAAVAWNAFVEVADKPVECAAATPGQAAGSVGDSSERYDDRVYRHLKDWDYRLARRPRYYM